MCPGIFFKSLIGYSLERITSRGIFQLRLLFDVNNSAIVMTGSEVIWAVFILMGLISVSDCQVMAIIDFGFEVFLHNKQWALSQKSLWFRLTQWWLSKTSDFPLCPGHFLLYAFWMNHIRTLIMKENVWTFHCSWKHFDDFTLAWALEQYRRQSLELSQMRDTSRNTHT